MRATNQKKKFFQKRLTEVARHRQHPEHGPRHRLLLLLGESGTGKEVCADAIHRRSPRASGPYVSLSCATVPRGAQESELFSGSLAQWLRAGDE